MNRSLFSSSYELALIVFHIIIGVLSLTSIFVAIFSFYLFLIFSVFSIVYSKSNRNLNVLTSIGYIFSMEVYFRMLGAAPFIPYESGKYLMLFYLLLGLLFYPGRFKNLPGIIMLLLLIPGFFFIPVEGFRFFFVNSYLGIVLVALSAMFFSGVRITENDLFSFFRSVIYPTIFGLTYILFSNSNLSSIEYSLSANNATTGGFGSNQVSTVLGASMFILILLFLKGKSLFSFIRLFDVFLLLIIGFRALITFSRGGVVGALLISFLAFFWPGTKSKGSGIFSQARILLIGFLFLGVFSIADELTGGFLSLRYQGESQGTAEGYREKDLNVITSRRSNLVVDEFVIFANNPVFGVGPGAGYEERAKFEGIRIASHTEATRLLAEHGVFGLVVALIFVFYPVYRVRMLKFPTSKYFSIAFFGIAVFTSMHSAMRTTITPLFWGLGCAVVIPTVKDLRGSY